MNKESVVEAIKKVFSRIMEVESHILTVGVEVGTDLEGVDVEETDDIVVELDFHCTGGVYAGLDVYVKNGTAILYIGDDETGEESGELGEMVDKLVEFIKNETSYDIL